MLWSPSPKFRAGVESGPLHNRGWIGGIYQFWNWGEMSCHQLADVLLFELERSLYFKAWERALVPDSEPEWGWYSPGLGYRSQTPKIQPLALVPVPPVTAPLAST